MRRILFFIDSEWAFGNIHNSLRKCLYPEYDCDVLCWSKSYTAETFKYLNDKYDLFWSTPAGAFALHQRYGVPNEKLVGLAHHDFDISSPVEQSRANNNNYIGSPKQFADIRGFAVVGKKLLTTSLAYGISRLPAVLPMGVHTRDYVRPMSPDIKRIGYFGRAERFDHRDFDSKRGKLAIEVAKLTGLELFAPQFTQDVHYLATSQMYRDIDLLMFCSLQEGQPCTAYEALAAGVPVLGTAAGVFDELAQYGGGGVLPYDEREFVAQAVEVIEALKADHSLYAKMHAAALSTSRMFDWAVLKPVWLEYLSSLFK